MSHSLVVVASDHTDLDDPRCARHWNPAVGVVMEETPGDHEQRRFVCTECAFEVMAEALIRHKDGHSFTPPSITPLNEHACDGPHCCRGGEHRG